MLDPSSTNPLREIADTLWWMLVGMTGGLAQLFVSGHRPSFYALMSCFFVSGFAGLMAVHVAAAGGLSTSLQGFICGMAGFGGPITLGLLYRKMMRSQFHFTNKEIAEEERRVHRKASKKP